MNKFNLIFGLSLLFLGGFVFAADFQVLQVQNCFNVSVLVRQNSGNLSIPSFDGCSNPLSGNRLFWICDCHNVQGVFNLTMHTDDIPLDSGSERLYSLNVNYSTYVLNAWQDQLIIKDYGFSLYAYPNEPVDIGQSCPVMSRVEFVNVSVPKFVYVYQNVTVEHNNTVIEYVNQSWENTSKIQELNQTLGYERQQSSENYWLSFIIMFILVCFCGLFYAAYRWEVKNK